MGPISLIKGIGKTSAFKKFGKIGTAMGVYGAYSDFEDARDQGDSIPASILQAAGSFVLYDALGGLMMAKDVVTTGAEFMQDSMQEMRQESANGQIPFRNAFFQDNQQFATMRQAGMAQAKKSEYTLQQSMMGNEAQYLHRE